MTPGAEAWLIALVLYAAWGAWWYAFGDVKSRSTGKWRRYTILECIFHIPVNIWFIFHRWTCK
jgi:hypothetical protein